MSDAEGDADFRWGKNGVLSQTIFTSCVEETVDSPRLWGESDLLLSSQESDLTAMNPLECYLPPVSSTPVDLAEVDSVGAEALLAGIEVETTGLEADSAGPEATSKIPSVDKFPGNGRFHVIFDASEKHSHYSSKLNKMFVMKGVKVPFKFAWDWEKNLISSPRVRAVLIFESAGMVEKPIESCHEHASPTDECNQRLTDESHAKHVVRCDHDQAQYCTDLVSGRLSVVVPLDPPQTGANNTTIMYSFGCRTSCPGQKGRPTLIVFTLEDSLKNTLNKLTVVCSVSIGKVYGRDLLHIQVSSSPKRDKMKAESCGASKSTKQGCSDKRVSTSTSATAAKRVKAEERVDTSLKNVKAEMSLEFLAVPVLNEAHRARVKDFAHGDLLVRIDKEQREATAQELQLIGHYTNIQSLEHGP